MNKVLKENIIIYIQYLILYAAGFGSGYITCFKTNKTQEHYPLVVRENVEFFLENTPNEKVLKEALKYYDIKYPDIVCAQAILETGHFRSKNCLENNNLFGLYDSKNKKYFKFNHWAESIVAYKNKIQHKYTGGDYYKFLKDIGYAEDSLYIKKIKNL